jgi:uncharacterized Zn-finger protein
MRIPNSLIVLLSNKGAWQSSHYNQMKFQSYLKYPSCRTKVYWECACAVAPGSDLNVALQVLGDEYSLRKHVDMHRPFACLRCEKRFDARHNLNMHMRVHEGGQTFTCVVCSRTLMSATRLRIHMRYHTGEQPRHCSLCPASFKEITPLKTHMRKVHNVKPYACEHCNHRFDFVRDVRAHAKAEH